MGKGTNKKTPLENKQTNPDCGMFFKYTDPVSLTREIQREEKVGNRRRGETLLIMRGFSDLSRKCHVETLFGS
jgi:hypothetical protein